MSVLRVVRKTQWRPARRHGTLAVNVCAVLLGLITVVAVFGPLLAPHDPLEVNPLEVHAPMSASHLLGTDDTGRDILSRLIVGARPSVIGPLAVIATAALVATALAILAGWLGGVVDALISRAFDLVFAFPSLILAIIAVTIFGVGLTAPVIALAIAYVPYIGRVMRTAAIRERSLPYVSALELQGFSGWWICWRHLLPNVLPLLIVQSGLAFGYALIDLAAISYVGLGVQPPAPEWGLMVASGQSSILAGYPQQSLFAGLTIIVTVVAVNILSSHFSARIGGRR